jgi:hypothetical protein
MELLNISFTVDQHGRFDLDTVIGRDVSYQSYPGPDVLGLLDAIAAQVVSAARRPVSVTPDMVQAVLSLPVLLQRLGERVQELIAGSEKLTERQAALFS